ncbi:DUF6191 domain-containing protein [Streptomyces sp. NPDC004244]|uniref:DUF6191 domain-containing protein n=1 Tax=Streptomyces sp. NPDC101206 TaxID=3366128 RepID=UPI00381B208A
MGFVVFMTLPGLALLLTAVAFLDLALVHAGRAGLLPWRWNGRRGQVPATGFEQLHASFSPGKQNELKERQSALVMRDDEEDGAPPRSRIDLTAGRAVIHLPPDGLSGGSGR